METPRNYQYEPQHQQYSAVGLSSSITCMVCLQLFPSSFMQKFKIRIEDPPRRKHMVFLGGAVLANIMKDKDSFWLTKAEYNEKGLGVLQKLGGGVR